jgi:hypothetical protein
MTANNPPERSPASCGIDAAARRMAGPGRLPLTHPRPPDSSVRSTSVPFSNLAPARTSATRWAALTARQPCWAVRTVGLAAAQPAYCWRSVQVAAAANTELSEDLGPGVSA